MKLTRFFVPALITIAAVATAQNQQFTHFLGEIKAPGPIVPLAADNDGHLFTGTFEGSSSTLYLIEDPVAETGKTTPTLTTIATFPTFVTLRGLQSLQATRNGDLFVAGDTGDANMANIWRFNKVPGLTLNYEQDMTFRANADLKPARRSGVSIYEDPISGTGVIIANGFNNIDFFDFTGNHLGGPFKVAENYMREGVYNSRDNVFYPIRNGVGSQEMLRGYAKDVSPAGVTLIEKLLISDGASNGASGSARQNAYYYADQNQLITMDSDVTVSGQPVPPAVRVWDVIDNGTSLSLAYRIEGTSETAKFTSIGDAVVSGNRLYISSSGARTIYVFGTAPASIKTWDAYEAHNK